MTLRRFRGLLLDTTRDSFKPLRTMPIIMAAAIMFAGIAAAQNSESDALKRQPFFSAKLSGFNEVHFRCRSSRAAAGTTCAPGRNINSRQGAVHRYPR